MNHFRETQVCILSRDVREGDVIRPINYWGEARYEVLATSTSKNVCTKKVAGDLAADEHDTKFARLDRVILCGPQHRVDEMLLFVGDTVTTRFGPGRIRKISAMPGLRSYLVDTKGVEAWHLAKEFYDTAEEIALMVAGA